jgi:hypothetical protein
MKQPFFYFLLFFSVLFFSSCCDETAQDYIIVEYIDVIAFDEEYFEDDIDEGFPELYAIIRINGANDFTSEVSYSQALPAFIDFESFLFIGEEMNIQVEILIFDEDIATTEDPIGNVTFVPSDFLLQRNRRETIQGGFLELDLILKWECDS